MVCLGLIENRIFSQFISIKTFKFILYLSNILAFYFGCLVFWIVDIECLCTMYCTGCTSFSCKALDE